MISREQGLNFVCGYRHPSGFWHFDGRDAAKLVGPANDVKMPVHAPEEYLSKPFGALGLADTADLHARLIEADIFIIPASSLQTMKQAQAIMDRAPEIHAPGLPPELMPQRARLAVSAIGLDHER